MPVYSELILPIGRICRPRRAPETPGGPLALKDVLNLVSFLNLASCCENMNDNLFIIIIMSYSLLFENPPPKKNKKTGNGLKAYEPRKRLFLERFPWARFETEWNMDKCVSSPRIRQKDARLENGVEVTRWSREAKLSCSGLQVLTLFIYICK